MKINRDDRVLVIAGKDKGRTGTVLDVDRQTGRVSFWDQYCEEDGPP